jgi:hypothetical protein
LKVKNPAYAKYEKVKNSAYAEYLKVKNLAYAEYLKVIRKEFWKLFANTENRIKAWK